MSERYTAYGIYQKLTYQEATAASPMAYTGSAYRCRHSQRAYGFAFDAYAQRTLYDAANTTCCNERVTPYGNKPQYKDSSVPMAPTDCQSGVARAKCTVLVVSVIPVTTGCAAASGYATPREFRVECPEMCEDMVKLVTQKTLSGTYGDFTFQRGVVNTLYANYALRSAVVSGIWDDCIGAQNITESFCRTKSIRFNLSAGFNKPAGCYCNCCSGTQGYPASVIDASGFTATWGNTQSPGRVMIDPACSGGSLTGVYSGIGGQNSVSWSTGPNYVAGVTTRRYSGQASTVGGTTNSACCGGKITWSGTNGCGSGYSSVKSWSQAPGTSGIIYSPTAGYTMIENSQYAVYASGVCSYVAAVPLNLSGYCLSGFNPGTYSKGAGTINEQTGILKFSGTHACSGCCGKGRVTGYVTNGCGSATRTQYWDVRRNYTNDASGLTLRCWEYLISGWYAEWAPYNCNGSSGFTFSGGLAGGYASLSDCNDAIATSNPSGIDPLRSACNVIGASGTGKCCRKWDNGLAHSNANFRSYVFQASGAQCCVYGTTNGAWVYSGLSTCCPN